LTGPAPDPDAPAASAGAPAAPADAQAALPDAASPDAAPPSAGTAADDGHLTDGPAARPGGPYGLFHFTIEGRTAPALFVAGWIAAIVGASVSFVGLLAGATPAGAILFVIGLAVVFVALLLLGGSQTIERRRVRLAYAGPAPILVFSEIVIGWYLAAVAVGTPLTLLGLVPTGPLLSLLGVVIQAVVVLALLRTVVIGPGVLSWQEMGLTRPDRAALRELAWGALLAAPVVIGTGVVVIGLITLIGQEPASPLPRSGTPGGLVLNLIAGALVAPFYEELFFRGFTLTAWRRMTGARQAIVRSAILFAAIHAMDQTGSTFAAALGVAIVAAAARLPVALVLGWVYDRRGSIWASIGLHAAFNAILLVIAERSLAG
jgi:membrane protease YdiL (CAAX protease family)